MTEIAGKTLVCLVIGIVLAMPASCRSGGGSDGGGDADTDTDTDTDTDVDADADADGDTDVDSDADGDADGDTDVDGVVGADTDSDAEDDTEPDANGIDGCWITHTDSGETQLDLAEEGGVVTGTLSSGGSVYEVEDGVYDGSVLTFTVVWDDWGFTCFFELTTVTPEFMSGISDCAGHVQDMTCDRTCGV